MTARGAIGWTGDVALGIRLTLRGRTSLVRLLLGTVGIGVATFVLLLAGSVQHIVSTESARVAHADPIYTQPGDGRRVQPLQYIFLSPVEFHGVEITARYLRATGPTSPVPPGLTRVPGADEAVVSPALARLIDAPAGASLRARLPAHITGVIGEAGLRGPQDLEFYAGFSPAEVSPSNPPIAVYGFGPAYDKSFSSLLALVILGVVALLLPVPVVILVSGRIAGAARDRRLAAIRLVGANRRQTHRIAAAESLVFACSGLVLGALLFLVFRQIAPFLKVFDYSVFTSDVVVSAPFVALIVVLVPLLTVCSAVFTLRRTVIEPLGVVTAKSPLRRRLWWRLVPPVIGVVALVRASADPFENPLWMFLVAIGTCMLLATVPALLPYLVEWITSLLRGGPPTWQLAVRRLQLDSGSAARVVSGIAVVLAGAIAVQTVLTVTANELDASQLPPPPAGLTYVTTEHGVQAQVDAQIQRSGVAQAWTPETNLSVDMSPNSPSGAYTDYIGIVSCAGIDRLLSITNCHDGDVFSMYRHVPPAGTRLSIISPSGAKTDATWPVPAHIRFVAPPPDPFRADASALLVTPSAIADVPLPAQLDATTFVWTDPRDPDAVYRVQDAVTESPLQAEVLSQTQREAESGQLSLSAVRTGLLIGSLFTLSLVGVSMLLLALEQIRERRRPLAMLAAVGVSRPMLARSLLWQVALPVAIGVVTAVGVGVGLADLVLRLITRHGFVVDWGAIGTFSGTAAAVVVLVTVASLPALLRATRISAQRTE